MEKRYKALRTIGTIYKILGVIGGIITILAMLAFCATSVFGGAMMDAFRSGQNGYMMPGFFGGVAGGIFLALGTLVYGGGASVTLYALGEGVYLLIELEENTRTTAMLLKRQYQE